MSLNAAGISGFKTNFHKQNVSSPLKANISPISKKGNFYSLSFSGNPNHILLVSAECRPFAKAGGMGDVNCEMPGVYNKENYGDKGRDEIRVMIPLYNAEGGPVTKNGQIYFKHTSGKEYKLERTGIKTDYSVGTKKSDVELFKTTIPENGVTVYFAYSPKFSKDKKEYTNPYSNMYGSYSAFSAAVIPLMKGLKAKEDFDAGVLHTTDWHTAFAIHNLHEAQKNDKFYDGVKTVHTFHNTGYMYQGAVEPIVAAVVNFAPEKLSKLLKDRTIKTELKKLGVKNEVDAVKTFIKEKETNQDKYNKKQVAASLNKINNRVRQLVPKQPWDKFGNYNPSKQAVAESDLMTTVSIGFRNEMLESDRIAPALRTHFKNNADKLIGVTNGLVPIEFNPLNAEFPFDASNYKEEKIKNKLALQKDLSITGERKIFGGEKNADIIEGHLDVNPDAMICAIGSRFDIGQKGFDILLKSSEKFLKENPNIQLVLGGAGFPEDSKLVKDFRKNVIEKYPGRVVFYRGYFPNTKVFPCADAVVAPSYYEPCGLVQLQAYKVGAVPILSNTGGHIDTVISPEQDKEKATGFKTEKSFYETKDPVTEYANLISKAYKVFENNKDGWNKMVDNGFAYDSSWSKAVKSYYKDVYHNPRIDTRKGEALEVCA